MGKDTYSDILGFDGRGGKSSTVTNRNVTASQIWVENSK